jgi:catechol 2,3-dioxygenase-like lactoylglutathione lyase family enzyme
MNQDTIGAFFHSVSYVVTDVGAAAERFSALVPGTVFSTHRIRLEPANRDAAELTVALECAAAPVGPRGEYEIRLLQPLSGDPIFHRALITAGPGLHHVGFRVPDLAGAARKFGAACPMPIDLRCDDGQRYLYYRCDPIGGLIELSETPAKASGSSAAVSGGNSLASHFTQIAYIVNDISAARQWTEAVLGCEVLTARDIVQGPSWNLHFRGRPATHDFGLKMVMARLGPTGEGQIELLEPQCSDNVLAEFLKEHGPGLNHIAFAVPDYGGLTGPLRATGVPPLKEIHVRGTVHSSYFDCTREELSTIEVFETGPHA